MKLDAAARKDIRENVIAGFRFYSTQKGTDPIVVAKERVKHLSTKKNAAAQYQAECWQDIINGYEKAVARMNDPYHASHGAV